MGLESTGLEQSNFSRLPERPVATGIARRFYHEVVSRAGRDRLLLSNHFTVNATLIGTRVSLDSPTRKDVVKTASARLTSSAEARTLASKAQPTLSPMAVISGNLNRLGNPFSHARHPKAKFALQGWRGANPPSSAV